jgi:hypothetical protein
MMMDDLTLKLHEQLDWHWQALARPRLVGLSDEEYLWEPAPGTWSVRDRDQESPASVTRRMGSGQWVFEYGHPEPDPAPVTSIAWRLAHVVVGVLGIRSANHFGGPAMSHDDWAFAGTAQEGLRQLDEAYAAWSAGVRALTPEALAAPVGPAEGDFAQEPMLTLVLHINREVIHHLAEVALLRDLWAHGVR